MSKFGVVFAFQVLPIIIFIAAFFSILYYYGVMQFIIRQLAKVMMRFMGASGAESMNVAASIFMGITEAPLTIRPFLPKVTRSELMTIMTSGMAHVSGAMLGAYILLGIEARHLLTAVIMTAPGTILIAKMLVPETEQPLTAGTVKIDVAELEDRPVNVLDAATKGTTDGLYPGAERRGDADFVSGDHCAAETACSAARTTFSRRTDSAGFPAKLERSSA